MLRFLKYCLVPLSCIAIISWLSGFRTSRPTSLDQAVYFSPLHLVETALGYDIPAQTFIANYPTQRPSLWQKPAILAAILGSTILNLLLLAALLRTRSKP